MSSFSGMIMGGNAVIMKEIISHLISLSFSHYTWNGDGTRTEVCGVFFCVLFCFYWAFVKKHLRDFQILVSSYCFSNLVSLLITEMLLLSFSLKLFFLKTRQISRASEAAFSRPGETLTWSQSRILELPQGLGAPKITQINRTRKLYTRITPGLFVPVFVRQLQCIWESRS